LLAAGQQPDRPVEQPGEAEGLRGVVDRGAQDPSAQPTQRAEQAQVLPARGGQVQRDLLRREPEPGARPPRLGADVDAVDAHPPGVGTDQAGHHPDEGALAGPVVSDQPDDLTGPDPQVEPVQRNGRTVPLAQSLRDQQRATSPHMIYTVYDLHCIA
jgi:hypothetical protein